MTINYSFLRPLKAAHLQKWYSDPFEKRNDLKVELYKNAKILPLKRIEGDNLLFGRGGVITENGKYVEQSAIKDRIQFSYEYSNCSFVDEKVVYCGYLVNQWGHFLTEAVARLWYFLKKDNDSIDHYVFFLQNNEKRVISKNYQEFFELLGIWDKVSFINSPTQYREVIVPELGYNRTAYYTEPFKDIFSKISNEALTKERKKTLTSYSKIFFSRSQIKNIRKKELGLDLLDNFFQKNGYKILYPEKISLSELLFYIKKADVIATSSGSVHHNILFAEDNKKIILIERNVINNEIQVDINRMKNLFVDYIDANIPIYPVHVGYGPFITAYNKYLEQYSIESGMNPPDTKYRSKRYLEKLFKGYMHSYINAYKFQWVMEDWYVKYADSLCEGYKDGFRYFGDFLTGRKPFCLERSFCSYWKHALRKLAFFLYSKCRK